MNKNENYLKNRLESGKDTCMLSFSHNACWPYLQQFESRYGNCKIDIFGDGPSYLQMRANYQLNDYDFIIFYSSHYFDDEELNQIKEMAFTISQDKNKRVSIGYSYVIPIEERKHIDISEGIKFISFSNGEEYEETCFDTELFTIIDLVNLVVKSHDELDKQKVKKNTYRCDDKK